MSLTFNELPIDNTIQTTQKNTEAKKKSIYIKKHKINISNIIIQTSK